MKIAVIGPGAIGTIFGGLLADAGHETWLIHYRKEFADEINERGVVIEDRTSDSTPVHVEVPATADAAAVGTVDLAMVLVRSYQTIHAVTGHEACIGPETRVLSLQNGVTNHLRLREHVGPDRTLVGITRQSGSLEAPGHAVRTGNRGSIFGGADGEFARTVADVFNAARIEATAVDDPMPAIWEKLALGGGIKPIAALTGLRNGAIVSDDALAAMLNEVMHEIGTVADARGISIDVDDIFEHIVQTKRTSTHKSSMLQDVEAERRTEIDDCNGAIVALADEAGIAVPYNRMVTALVRGLERGYLDGV